jgi:hypothetical protein
MVGGEHERTQQKAAVATRAADEVARLGRNLMAALDAIMFNPADRCQVDHRCLDAFQIWCGLI